MREKVQEDRLGGKCILPNRKWSVLFILFLQQQKKALLNSVGAYIVDVYADKKGNIQYFEAEPMLWGPKDFWDEAGKDKEKVRKLEIKNAA